MKALKLELCCQSYAAESSVGSQFQVEHIDSLLAKILFAVGRDIAVVYFVPDIDVLHVGELDGFDFREF
jgi:hypothetical protein